MPISFSSKESKIQNLKDLIKKINKIREQGKKIVTYSGSFDLLHIGHIKGIREASLQGDVLVILLNSDQSVKLYKGPNRPIVSQKDRAEMLAALEAVNYIVLFDEITPLSILNIIRPDIHCNGTDWGKNCVERKIIEENCGKIHVLRWEKGYSTSNLIKRIIEIYKKPTIKAIFLDRDGVINYNKDGYIHKIEDFEFIPETIKGLQKLSKSGYMLIVVTNQSGLGRGFYKEEDFFKLNNWMIKKLAKRDIKIDKIYHCCHHPANGCECRKPKIGMFLQAVQDYGISLNDSWLIGDGEMDIEAGRSANIKTIKIGAKMPRKLKIEPHFYSSNVLEASNLILKKL